MEILQTFFNIGTATFVSVLALALVWAALTAFDKLIFPTVDFANEIRSGNAVVGKVVVAIIVMTFGLVGFVMAAPVSQDAARLSAGGVHRYDMDFRKAAKWNFGNLYEWQVFKAQAMTESGMNPTAMSRVGAAGLMQFMAPTAREMGLDDRFDARASIKAGVAYDMRLWLIYTARRTIRDRLRFAFMAYNAGPGSVARFQRAALAAGDDPDAFESLYPHAWKEPREYVERIERWEARFLKRGDRWNS